MLRNDLMGMKLGLISLLALGFAVDGRSQTNSPGPELVPATILAWDADLKQYDAKTNEPNAFFTFWVTNVSPADVAILNVNTSCGCTAAQLPSLPWILPAGSNGPVRVTVDLRGRSGAVMKGVTVTSSQGIKALVVRANVPLPATATNQPPSSSPRERPAAPPRRKW